VLALAARELWNLNWSCHNPHLQASRRPAT
jgi:hypothetical protein